MVFCRCFLHTGSYSWIVEHLPKAARYYHHHHHQHHHHHHHHHHCHCLPPQYLIFCPLLVTIRQAQQCFLSSPLSTTVAPQTPSQWLDWIESCRFDNMMMVVMMEMVVIFQVRAQEDIAIGNEVTTRYGGLNIGQVNHHGDGDHFACTQYRPN